MTQDTAAADRPSMRLSEPAMLPTSVGSLRVRDMGPGAGAGGTPLLLVHGLGGDIGLWAFNQAALAARRRVVAFDLPGHAGSTKDIGDATVPTLARAIDAVVDTLDLGPVHLVGLSFGGALALDFARRRPEGLRSLTLVSACGLGSEVDTSFLRDYLAAPDAPSLAGVLRRLSHEPLPWDERMLASAMAAREIPGYRQAVSRIIDTCFPGNRQIYVDRALLGEIAVPTQLVWGAEDGIVPAAHARCLPAGMPVHILAEVGHVPNMEAPARFNALLGDFLDSADPA